jgi:hypothetical protein
VARSGDEGALTVDDRPFVDAPDVAERRSTPAASLLGTLRRRRSGRLLVSALPVLLFPERGGAAV